MKNTILFIIGIFLASNSFSQSYEQRSITEFQSGKVSKYSTFGLGKSNGLKLHIKYPQSWKSYDGERPHVVKKFVQPDDYTLLNVLINKLQEPLSKTEIEEIFSVEGLKTLLPENSNYLSSNLNLRIEGLKAGSVDYKTTALRMNRQFNTYARNYVVIYNEYVVMIQFMVMNKEGESDVSVKSRFVTLKPLFDQIFNSVVIDNVWE
jgi:ethanolamine utilization microcompartment shell protein EutS